MAVTNWQGGKKITQVWREGRGHLWKCEHTWYLSLFYTTAIWGHNILQLKVRKFAAKLCKFFSLYATFCTVFLPIGKCYTWLIFTQPLVMMAVTNIKCASAFLFGYLLWSFTSVSFVSLLDWDKGFWIFSPGSHSVEDKGTTAVFKEFSQSSQNCMGHKNILKNFLFMRRMFSGKQYHSLCPCSFISYFHFLRIWRTRRSCNSQFSISFQTACTAATPTTWCQGPTLEQKTQGLEQANVLNYSFIICIFLCPGPGPGL